MQGTLLLFIDGSVNTKARVGFGAYLAVYEQDLSLEIQKSAVKVKQFENTTSSQLELQTLLWALDDFPDFAGRIVIYTDSQAISELRGRRDRLETNDFRSGKNQFLRHHELYRRFYRVTDRLDCEIIKVKGHQPMRNKGIIDRLFTLVDRTARKAMKAEKRDGSTDF